MLQQYLTKFLVFIIAADIVIAGVLVIFIINIRIILRQKFYKNLFEIRTIKAAQQSETSEEAAQEMGMLTEEFLAFCKERNILTPEVKKERIEKAEKRKNEDMRRVMEEEANWRAEQERIAEQNRKEKEEEAKKRKERLRKFGIS